jgi:hypothetical protein
MDKMTSWRKASYSSTNGGNCVEVASQAGTIAVRDSKNPEKSQLRISPGNWQAFTGSLKGK